MARARRNVSGARRYPALGALVFGGAPRSVFFLDRERHLYQYRGVAGVAHLFFVRQEDRAKRYFELLVKHKGDASDGFGVFFLVELQLDDFGRVDLVSAKLALDLVPELVVVVEEYGEFVHEHFSYLVVVWFEEPVEDLVVQLFLLLAVVHHHSR